MHAPGTRSGVRGTGVQGYRSTKVPIVLDGWTPNELRGGRAVTFAPGGVEVWEDSFVVVVQHESIDSAQREHPIVSCVYFTGARGSANSGAASIRFCKEAVAGARPLPWTFFRSSVGYAHGPRPSW